MRTTTVLKCFDKSGNKIKFKFLLVKSFFLSLWLLLLLHQIFHTTLLSFVHCILHTLRTRFVFFEYQLFSIKNLFYELNDIIWQIVCNTALRFTYNYILHSVVTLLVAVKPHLIVVIFIRPNPFCKYNTLDISMASEQLL